jgi:hypothetical protein
VTPHGLPRVDHLKREIRERTEWPAVAARRARLARRSTVALSVIPAEALRAGRGRR